MYTIGTVSNLVGTTFFSLHLFALRNIPGVTASVEVTKHHRIQDSSFIFNWRVVLCCVALSLKSWSQRLVILLCTGPIIYSCIIIHIKNRTQLSTTHPDRTSENAMLYPQHTVVVAIHIVSSADGADSCSKREGPHASKNNTNIFEAETTIFHCIPAQYL